MEAVLFDLDGLLADTEIISLKVYQELLEDFGIPFTEETYSREYSGHREEENVQRFLDTYDLPWNFDQTLDKVYELEARILAKGVNLKKGSKNLLAFLQREGILIALATSSVESRARIILDSNGILSLFDHLVFAKDVKRSKPYPDIFLKACSDLNVLPENCLVLEDSEAGIEAAYRAGIPVICIPDLKIPAQSFLNKTEQVFQDLDAVRDYLECKKESQ
ncbi:HAD family hydrolase [Streptococcus intermedius]|uniref:HAD family hydrolase n=1 Tax=Streptococcus intermedius TaxID=1338 RepID=UPI000C85CE62|nr:HAD family phosphatase [Streptococcus intermedius]PMR64336.1 carbohydrate phosphatase [Streptococcus intermedius]WOI91159.1 HAD family phosphatase [Streptococcus intermedius]